MPGSLPKLIIICLAGGIVLGQAERVAAQAAYPNLPRAAGRPSQPILSPYLQLLREDTSVTSPYHAFVLPQREMAQQQLWQAAEIQSLDRQVRAQAIQNNRARMPTGGGGYFQQYLHFYSPNGRP